MLSNSAGIRCTAALDVEADPTLRLQPLPAADGTVHRHFPVTYAAFLEMNEYDMRCALKEWYSQEPWTVPHVREEYGGDSYLARRAQLGRYIGLRHYVLEMQSVR